MTVSKEEIKKEAEKTFNQDYFKFADDLRIQGFMAGAQWMQEQYASQLRGQLKQESEQTAIAFAEWISGQGYVQYDGKERWIAPQNNNNVYNTEEIFQMFLDSLK